MITNFISLLPCSSSSLFLYISHNINVYFFLVLLIFFFFKQKTAYEMRISDWSSDVCSSDLQRGQVEPEIGDFQHLVATSSTGTRYQRFQADFEFRQVEWFGQVVVGAGPEACDLVGQLIPGGEHEYRDRKSVV